MEESTIGAKMVSLRVAGWFGERDIELAFPSTWEVTERRMAGHDKPALTDEEMRAALRNPFGTPRLSELAKGKQKAVILFDDLPKPTPTSRIIPFVLEEMHAGGITDDQIRFVNAPGTHRHMTYGEFAVKLGADIVEKYPVYQHNAYENLVEVGTTSNGTPVIVNREFMSCDLRVGIGSIIPHQSAGFGAGGKIILPGIAGMKTVAYHHTNLRKGPNSNKVQLGLVDDNPFRLDIEEAARLAGLQFKVDCVLNNHREVAGLFAGDFVAEHRAGVKLAREIYTTEMLKEMDVLVNNGYPDECQFMRSTWPVPISLKEGGDVVIVNHAHAGQVVHQWNGRFGTDYGGGGWSAGGRARHLAKAGRVIIMAPFLAKVDRMEFGAADKVVWYKSWGEVLADLVSRHGSGTKVGVYPYTPIQLPA
jgi:nickel-dependent lactate racemase